MEGRMLTCRRAAAKLFLSFFLCLPQIVSADDPTDEEVFESAKEKGKLVAEDYMSRNILPTSSGFNYFDACSYYGACLHSRACGDTAYYRTVYNKYRNNKPGYISTGDVDKNSCGLIALHLFNFENDSSLLTLGKAPADVVVQATYAQKTINTSSVYVRTAIDDTYMVGSLMVQTYRATLDTSYLDFCADYILHYMEKLQQEATGLYWHKHDSKNYWGRGNGWGAAATTELLQELPQTHPKYEDVLEGYRKQMAGLLAEQQESGLWMQLIGSTDSKNWIETSGSAMFLFAMFTGLKNGWLDMGTYLEPAKKGWMKLVEYLQGSKLTSVAAGFWPTTGTASDYLNASRGQPGDSHGTAAFLWAATAAVELLKPTSVATPFVVRQSEPHINPVPAANVQFDLMGRAATVGARGRAAGITIMKTGELRITTRNQVQ